MKLATQIEEVVRTSHVFNSIHLDHSIVLSI
jgi:hypothetical protein